MHIVYDKVIDTSVLFARKNGSKMKLKTIAFQLLQVKRSLFREPSKWENTVLRRIAELPLIFSDLGSKFNKINSWIKKCTYSDS